MKPWIARFGRSDAEANVEFVEDFRDFLGGRRSVIVDATGILIHPRDWALTDTDQALRYPPLSGVYLRILRAC
jgi:hypothetical protein